MIIESKDNKHFKEFRKLTTIDGARKYGKVIVSGKKLLRELAQSASGSCLALITHERYADDDAAIKTLIERFAAAGSLHLLKKHLFNELDTFNTGAPLLVIQIPEILEWDYQPCRGLQFTDPVSGPLECGCGHTLCRRIWRKKNNHAQRSCPPLSSPEHQSLGRSSIYSKSVQGPVHS